MDLVILLRLFIHLGHILCLPNNTGITFTAFQKIVEEDVAAVSINEINNLISQNNYLGLYVKVLGEHIGSLDKKIG